MKLAYPFIQARNYTPARRDAADVIVIHTMEAGEKPGTARAVAAWFAGATAPRASAHFCIDNHEVIQCVDLADVAWHAPGANRVGIGLEHAGFAKQSVADWSDEYSRATLERSAFLVAELCRLFRIPVVKLSATDLRSGARGVCGHVDVSKAFKGSDHYDPGPNFPWASYLARVVELVRSDTDPAPAPAPTTPVAPPMPDLWRGMKNEDVRQAQALLNQRASTIAPLVEDGSFGPKTDAAVKAFQGARHLPETGVVDAATWRELHR